MRSAIWLSVRPLACFMSKRIPSIEYISAGCATTWRPVACCRSTLPILSNCTLEAVWRAACDMEASSSSTST